MSSLCLLCVRYWYENDIPPSSFSKEQLNELRKVTLAHVVCENIESIDFVQPNVFLESDPFLNALMPCRGDTIIKKMNLNAWATASPRLICIAFLFGCILGRVFAAIPMPCVLCQLCPLCHRQSQIHSTFL